MATSNWRDTDSYLGEDLSFRAYFQDAVRGQPGRFYGIGSTTGEAGYYLAHGLEEHGKIIGVAVIKVAQRTGIPLAEIQAALSSLPANRTPTAADWKRLSARWRDALDARINSLIRLRDQLDGCIGCGCLSLKACPLRNPWDELADEGPGARLLEGDT